MALRYRIPLPGVFYYSGRVGPKHWLPRGNHTGDGPIGFMVKWFITLPERRLFGAGLAIMLVPFYGVFWVVRRSLRNRQRLQPVAQCFPVRRLLLRRPALRPISRSYGFVPAQRPVPALAYAPSRRIAAQRECPAVEGRPFGSDRYV